MKINYKHAIDRITKRMLYPFQFTIHQYPNAIGLWQNEQESLAYYGLLADPNYNWMEIGSFCGGSATILCLTKQYLNAPNKKIVSVDRNFFMHHDETAYSQFFYNTSKFPDMSEAIACDSIDLNTHYNGEKLSLAFIDGWHSFKGALLDFQIVEKWLTNDAIVIFHDVAQQPWTEQFIEERYKVALNKYNEWMGEKLPNSNGQEQTYNLDEVTAYIIKEYNYRYINNEILDGTKNCMVGIQKVENIYEKTGQNSNRSL